MSRDFDGSTDSALNDNDPAGALPITLLCWHNPDIIAAGEIMDITVSTSNNRYITMTSQDHDTDSTQECSTSARNTQNRNILCATSIPLDTWHVLQGNFVSSTSREAFVDGAADGTNTQTSTYPAINRIAMGRLMRNSPASAFDGRIGLCCEWSVDVDDTNTAAMGRGAQPFVIDDANLVFYAPLEGHDSPEVEYISRNNLTLSGTSKFAGNPPIEPLENFL